MNVSLQLFFTNQRRKEMPIKPGHTYATCEICEKEMVKNGCCKHRYTINWKKFYPIKCGDDHVYGTCHDCGAKPGQYHH